jgi:hypothetical protein
VKPAREIPADIRQLIVQRLGAALASAWRRQHEGDRRDSDREGEPERPQPARRRA